jgi:hypothetical protein
MDQKGRKQVAKIPHESAMVALADKYYSANNLLQQPNVGSLALVSKKHEVQRQQLLRRLMTNKLTPTLRC